MIKKIVSFFGTIFGFIIGCFTFWKLGKKHGVLEERKESEERHLANINNALSIRNNSDIDELRKRYKISDE